MKKKTVTRQKYRQPDLLIMPDATPEELRATAAALTKQVAAIQDELGASNGAFAKPYAGMDGSTWGRIRSTFVEGVEKYVVQDWRSIISKLQGALAMLAGKTDAPQAEAAPLTLPTGVLKFSFHQKIINDITSAMATDRDRLIVIIGKTGAGKTFLSEVIKSQFPTKALSIIASRPWITRYSPLFRSMAQALGLAKIPRAAFDLQEKVIGLLKVSQRVIIIDGFQYAGLPTVDGVKYTLESTNCPVVVLTTPEQWKHIKDEEKGWDNVDQLKNRIFAQYHLDELPAEDVTELVKLRLPQFPQLPASERDSICKRLVTAGKHFGLWNKINGLCKAVALRAQGKPTITVQSFVKAEEDLAEMGRY